MLVRLPRLPHEHGRAPCSWACSCLFALAVPSLRLRGNFVLDISF